jgi:ABC-type multidrug transport system permease subunit
LVAKVLAEIPLDVAFSAVFTTVLKQCSGLQISWQRLTATFSLLTTAGASLGYLIGSLAPTEQFASSAGVPVLVILMVVGVINPSGVDLSSPPPCLISLLKQISPFTFAIEALCLGEYPGVKFASGSGGGGFLSRLKNAPRMGGLALVNVSDRGVGVAVHQLCAVVC